MHILSPYIPSLLGLKGSWLCWSISTSKKVSWNRCFTCTMGFVTSVRRYIRRRRMRLMLLLPLLGSGYILLAAHDFDQNYKSNHGEHKKDSDSVEDPVFRMREERYQKFAESEASRSGPGEHGAPVVLRGDELAKSRTLEQKEGFNIVASDKVSLERSLKDVRNSQ